MWAVTLSEEELRSLSAEPPARRAVKQCTQVNKSIWIWLNYSESSSRKKGNQTLKLFMHLEEE